MTNIAKTFNPAINSFPFVPGKALSALVTPLAQTSNPTATPSGVSGDTVSLSPQAEECHLFEGLSKATASVKVQPWGTGNDDCIERILAKQGYSREEMYTKNSEGLDMLQQVARANNLKNPNMVAEGFDLRVPTKLVADDVAESESIGDDSKTEATQAGDDNSEATKPYESVYINLRRNIRITVHGEDPAEHARAYALAFGDADTDSSSQVDGHSHENSFINPYNFSNLYNLSNLYSLYDLSKFSNSNDFSDTYNSNSYSDADTDSDSDTYSEL